ncbi:MAG: sigma-70 family RNA polymerase sigma factor [Pyrinomonadaceae bacterium]|nr:sigma-70 family RNA polymerase sigma factor [Pyrinomonadaceae bacterium]
MPTFNKNSAEDFEAEALPHLSELFRTAVRLTESRSEAEDLMQEVYMQAWKSFHCFELGTNCRAWLFKILSHKFKHHRCKKSRFKFIGNSEKALEALTYEPSVRERLSNAEILSSLERVPLCYRQVLLLADVEEFSYKEIAAMLVIPMGTVMSRLSRGRKLLRVELSQVAESCEFEKNEKAKSASVLKFLLGRFRAA